MTGAPSGSGASAGKTVAAIAHQEEEERAKWEKLHEKEMKEKTYKNIYQSRRNSEKHVEEEAEEGEHSPSPSPIPWKQHREKRPKRHSRRNTFHDESENILPVQAPSPGSNIERRDQSATPA